MALQLQNFSSIVQNSAAAVQGACAQLLDLTTGSVLRAILEANASVALWIQWLIVQVLSVTRLATSTGTDVDSFVNDFTMVRLPAVAATGSVTFSRLSIGLATLIPVGAQVKTADGTQTFVVTVDTANPAWNAAQNGYNVGTLVFNVTVPVIALTPGSGGNVQALPMLLASAIPGIDNAQNTVAFTNGIDAETDTALKARFVLFIAGLSKATAAAIASAIASVQQGLNYAIVVPTAGTFIVVIDDGSGTPSTALQNAVFAAVDSVRPVGTTFAVIPPVVTHVAVTLTIAVVANVNKTNTIGPVVAAITAYINTLQIGATLPITKISQVAYDAVPGAITNVTLVRLNAGTADIAIGATGVVKMTSCVVS